MFQLGGTQWHRCDQQGCHHPVQANTAVQQFSKRGFFVGLADQGRRLPAGEPKKDHFYISTREILQIH